MKEAVIVVDMINDFVHDRFGSEPAQKIVPDLRKFLENAQDSDKLVIYTQDSHSKDDPEMDVWGEHAMEGEKGSETIDELEGFEDVIIRTSTYDPFYKTDLNKILEEHGIEKVILAGVSTDICVQHTAGGAFIRGYKVTVLEDCTAAMSEDKHEPALDYMRDIYGAEIRKSTEIIEEF